MGRRSEEGLLMDGWGQEPVEETGHCNGGGKSCARQRH